MGKERHHIVPKCLGGSDEPDNLVYLTAEEHILAHQKLAEQYPDHRGVVATAVLMSGKGDVKVNAKIREKHLANLKELNKGSGNGMYGKTHTEEARAKMSAARIKAGGTPHSEKHKESMRGDNNVMAKPSVKEKHSLALNTEAYKDKQRAAIKRNGNPMDRPEVKEKHRLAMERRKRINYEQRKSSTT